MPSPIQVWLTVMQGTWGHAAKVAMAAEKSRLDGLGVADTPLLERDVYLSCAAAALHTRRVNIVTGVTNPVTRHPSVAAAAFAQLNELAPGRVVCGIATGDSAVWGVGLKPARTAFLREYILALKALLRGEPTTWRGQTFTASWQHFEPFDLPVYVACAGPMTVRMAAQVGDGLILSVGVSAQDLQWVQGEVEHACNEVNRSPAEVDLWHYTEIQFAESKQLAAQQSLGSFSRWLSHGGTDGKRIPAEFLTALTQLNADRQNLEASYTAQDAGVAMVRRAKELGLYDWLMSRSACLWGTPAEVAERLKLLRARGASKWMLYPGSRYGDDAQTATKLGEVLEILAST